jgi:ribosomal protein S18 acetylase RimI-like enzyme
MVHVEFVPYDEDIHKTDYIDMFLEYGKWLDDQVLNHYGFHLFADADVKRVIDRLVPRFTSYDSSEGIILILKVDSKTAGMARLDKFGEDIGFIHNVYIYPEYRGKGYSKQMMYDLEERANKFGYSSLRLDAGGFNVVAKNLYRKLGYHEIERFTDFDNLKIERTRPYYQEKIYMEKKL